MKKMIFALAALFTVNAYAVVTISWNSVSPTSVTTDGATPAPTTYFAQLIWAPTATQSLPDPSNPLVPVGSGEQVLASQALNAFALNGFIIATPIDVANSFAGGFVYSRVFDTATPTFGSFFGQSSNFGGNTVNPLLGLTITTSDPTTSNDHFPAGVVVNQVIAIPEPSVLGMLFLGLAFVAKFVRRK